MDINYVDKYGEYNDKKKQKLWTRFCRSGYGKIDKQSWTYEHFLLAICVMKQTYMQKLAKIMEDD